MTVILPIYLNSSNEHRILKFLFSLLICITAITAYSQNSETPQNAYKLFDKVIGIENTELSNGVEYIEQHIIRNNRHKYFLSSQFQAGDLFYDGQPYFDVLLKFNVVDDILLASVQNSDGTSTFQLYNEKIGSFRIEDHSFLNITDNASPGFYEILLDLPNISLLKKHLKKTKKHLDRNYTYFEFEKDDPVYEVRYNDSYFSIDSRRDILNAFPEHEKQVRFFYRNNKSLRKENREEFLIRLLQDLNQQL